MTAVREGVLLESSDTEIQSLGVEVEFEFYWGRLMDLNVDLRGGGKLSCPVLEIG